MKLGFISLVYAVLLQCNTAQQVCNAPADMGPKDTRCVISNKIDGRPDMGKLHNVTWDVVNGAEGIVEVQFPFLHLDIRPGYQCPKIYNLSLEVKDGDNYLSHSQHNVWVVASNSKNSIQCGERARVNFTHVYTGKYKLKIDVDLYCTSCAVTDFSTTMDIETRYKKPIPNQHIGRVTTDHPKIVFEVFNIDTPKIKYTLKYNESCDDDQPCNSPVKGKSNCSWIVRDGMYKHCFNKDCRLITTTNCSWFGDFGEENEKTYCGSRIIGKYHKTRRTYEITVLSVTAGCYCVKVEKLDSRTEGNGAWKNMCLKKTFSPFVLVKPLPPEPVPPLPPPPPAPEILITILTVILFILAIIFLYVLWWKLRKAKNSSSEEKSAHQNVMKVTVETTKPEVLLLYPRDCEPLMELMKQFRELVSTTCDCKVYDYHDQEQADEIDRKGTYWLFQKIQSPNTKVVLVENACSVLHQRAHFDELKITPRNVQSRDHFFLLALVALMPKDNLQEMYQKVYVIRFDPYLDDGATLRCISECIRYIMPVHLRKLLIALGFYACEEQIQIDQNMEKALIDSIENFNYYSNRDRYYIMDIYGIYWESRETGNKYVQ